MSSYEKNINKLFKSFNNLLIESKEQRLKMKLAKEVKNSIFTDEILKKINEHDFTGIVDGDEDAVKLFSVIFPIFIKKDDVVFRLYKHKIEVDLSDEMKDRYIYMFSDGRLTSGLFECFNISDDEYVYGIKQIIDVIPLFKEAILDTLCNYKKNINNKKKLESLKSKEIVAENNYNTLINYLSEKNRG